ncbi:Dopey, N-terminal-domain-containing protein [Catenaria anguillulae PL171]|uniref:Dopey, N-terminal-domain-containing protein n=1 Tax=Catenaria anguillulae PL171 TaxID=765915 RepID=A0A1Y2HDD1_9FUNG|nr:Dopey, N-terminal-domain-containing protein [Catenaria anguillulae PL171]
MSTPDLFTSIPDSDKDELARNPRLRRYAQAVDKVLVSFDSIVEWPDIVTFLSKLGKTVQGHPEFPTIPAKFTIAKRLAQCLNPNLPAGVHQKALETFVIIFEAIGPGNLARDSHIWLYGLFPYFAHAPMSVKPLLLSLVDIHLLPLRLQLHPILRSLLMALLPGLEEEDNEHFDAHLALMDRLQQQVEGDHFFSALWSIVASSPQTRRTALVYLIRRVATLRGSPEQITIALATCFVDKNLLVQRLALDLLVARFPVHRIKAEFGQPDVVYLTGEALKVVLRRDMSLNRRLHAWLLGDDDHYFQQIVRSTLASTLLHYISNSEPICLVRTVKIMISLLDKEEIAISMLQDTLGDVLRAFSSHSQSQPNNAPDDDVRATFCMFLDMLDPIHVWRELVALIGQDGFEACRQLEFHISNVPLGDEEEVYQLHLPLACIRLLQLITSRSNQSHQQLLHSVVVLLGKLATQASFSHALAEPVPACPDSTFIAEFYSGQQSLPVNHVPLVWFVSLTEELIYGLIAPQCTSGSSDTVDILRQCVQIVSTLGGQPGSHDKLVSLVFACTEIDILVPLLKFALLLPSEALAPCATRLLRHIFDCFRPRGDAFDVETVRVFWLLLDRFPSCFRQFIAILNEAVETPDGYDAFGVVWKHSQNRPTLHSSLCEPLFTILQSLQRPGSRLHAERWVRSYLSSYIDVLRLVCSLLSDPLTFREPLSLPIDAEVFAYHGAVDLALMDFAFRTLYVVFSLAGSQLVDTLTKPATLDATTSFGELIVTACCNVLETVHETDQAGNGALHSSACDCLVRVLESNCPISHSLFVRVQDSLCTSLRIAQLHAQHDLQASLLVAALILFRGIGSVQSAMRRGTLLGSNFALALLDSDRPSSPSPSSSTLRSCSPPPSQVPVSLQLALQSALSARSCRPVLDNYIECCMLLVDKLGAFVETLHTILIDQLRKSIFNDRDEMSTLAFLRALQFLFSRAFGTRDKDDLAQTDGPRTANLSESSGGLSSISTYVTGVFSPTASTAQPAFVAPSHWLLPIVVGKLPDVVALMFDVEKEQKRATTHPVANLFTRTSVRLQRLAALAIRSRQGDWVDACILQARTYPTTVEWMTLQVKVSQLDLAVFLTSAMTNVLRRVTNGPKDNIILPVPPASSLPIIAALVTKCNVDFASTWPQVQLFLRDYLNLHPSSVAPEVVVIASKYAEELIDADRKVAKDAIDTFLRMLDSFNVTLVSFVFQADDLQRRGLTPDSAVSAVTKDVTDALLAVCKEVVIPSVRKVIKDTDRASAVFSNIVHYLVQPIFRQTQHPCYNGVLQLMQEIAQVPSSARTWRREVWDHFMDHRFFPVPLVSFPSWSDLLARYAHEADRINEVLNRIAPASSGTLFGSREQEIMTRCQLVRRVSVLLWCSDSDRHIAAVPVLQEKVMDLFGLQHSDMNYELFLLARVLILRFSDMHLTNMWAILVGEMMRILDLHAPDFASSNEVNPSREAIISVTAVCKLLDLVTAMQHSDFQIYLPVFVGEGPSLGLLGGVCSWDEARRSTSNLDIGEQQRTRQLDLLLGDNIGPSQAELGRFAVNFIGRSRHIGSRRTSHVTPNLSAGVVPDLVSSLQHR